MLEKAFSGGRGYWGWIGFLLLVVAAGVYSYLHQLGNGLGVTGLSRDVSWGFYISQFTFLVGVAASAVMVVLPYYLHDFKAFGRITMIGEQLAIAAVVMCICFVVVDLGQPGRAVNMMRYPSPRSILFWDAFVLSGYFVLNVVISRVSMNAERNATAPPKWIKPVIILSIPWAISIHTVTAFLYSGLAARPFWMTAVLAPRFLASAFASGPALLILICLLLKRLTKFDAGEQAIQKLATIATYAVLANIFFVLMEFFTAFYSSIPHHMEHFQYLYVGLDGHAELVPWMWLSAVLVVAAALILVNPRLRRSPGTLTFACIALIISIWLEKGLGMVVTGFVPSPLGHVTAYAPTLPEIAITCGIYAGGALLVTMFYRITTSLRGELKT